MIASIYFQEKPLAVLHFVGWAIYIAADYVDHAMFENYHGLPTVASGVAGYMLTGMLALFYVRCKRFGTFFQHALFFTLLYGFAVIWHQVHGVVHYVTMHEPTTFAAEIGRLFQLPFRDWFATGVTPIFLFLAWAGFFFLARQYIARRDEQTRLKQLELETKKAQLQTLRHQLNPHFLFNILNSIDVSVQSDDKDTAHKMTQHLSRFLRGNLEQGALDKIPFAQELAMLRDFVAIEELRFQGKLRVSFDVDESTKTALVPAMLFQPLMENAVKYAWSQVDEGFVNFRATRSQGQLQVSIINSKSDVGHREGTGTGLKNTRERLSIQYGSDATIHVQEDNAMFKVALSLPIEVVT